LESGPTTLITGIVSKMRRRLASTGSSLLSTGEPLGETRRTVTILRATSRYHARNGRCMSPAATDLARRNYGKTHLGRDGDNPVDPGSWCDETEPLAWQPCAGIPSATFGSAAGPKATRIPIAQPNTEPKANIAERIVRAVACKSRGIAWTTVAAGARGSAQRLAPMAHSIPPCRLLDAALPIAQ
jgi:hypothetical protein